LHICFLTDHYPEPGGKTGGIGVFVQTLGRMLVQNGVQVSVVGAGYNATSIKSDEGVQVYRIKKSKWPVAKFAQHIWQLNSIIKKIHKKKPIHIIECSEVGLVSVRKIKGVKKVIRMHGGHHFFIHAQQMQLVLKTVWQEKISFKIADAICAVSQYVNTETAKYLNYNPANTTIIPNGVIPQNIQKLAVNTPIIPGRIVFVGTICEKKGARQLVQAFAAIKAAVPNATLYMVGPDWFFPNGESYTTYLQQYITPNIAPFITFTGPLANTEVPKLIASAQVSAYPSHMEAMPIAWLEAMALGKPILASNTGPGPEVITHLQQGILCNPYEPQSIANGIIELLTNSELAQQLGLNAMLKVQQHFDMQVLVHQNIAFYNSVVNNKI
jgi:glycosyltransferase involved in cell wall biosynthesis